MSREILRKKLDRETRKVAVLEQMIEDHTRRLYRTVEELRATNETLSA